MTLSEQLLNSALDMAARGFRVFPLRSGAKQPAFVRWQETATTDEATIRRLWAGQTFNVGVLMDRGQIAVDIDVKSGKQGAQSFAALGLSVEDRDTFRVRTASGGWHVYYATEDDFGNSPGDLGPGIDVRGGGHGYVVGPGSVLTNGSGEGTYRIEHDAPVRGLPEGLRVRLRSARSAVQSTSAPLVDLDDVAAVERARRHLHAEAALAVERQNGDLTTYKVAAQIKDFGVSKEVAFELMLEHWNERCSPPWEPEQLREKVNNAYSYGLESPGSSHPGAAFGGVDIPADVAPRASDDKWYRHGEAWDRNVRWLYHQTLPCPGVAVIVGAPNSGKTFVNVELARSLATGKPFFGVAPDMRCGSVFLFGGTEGSSVPMRLHALGESDRLPISTTAISDLSARGALGRLLDLLRGESKRMRAEFGVPLGLVILETLSASGLLVDENSNSEIGVAFANLGTLSRELGALVMTTHHPPKNGEGARGGSAIVASADYVLEITREGTDAVRFLDLTKARDAEQRPLGTFTLLPVPLGEDDRGRPITSMTVSMGEVMTKKGRRSQYSDVLMQALEFALLESTVLAKGFPAAEWDDVMQQFTDLKGGSKERSNVSQAFKRTVDYAKDAGAVDSEMIDGVRYIWMKELT